MGHHGGDVLGISTDLGEGGGHAQSAEEGPQALYTLPGGALGAGEVHLTAEHALGKLGKAHGVMGQDVLHPCGHHHRKARAVGAVIEGRELMLHLVAGPVLVPAHAAGVVVGQHAGPHEVCTGGVVVRVGNGPGSGVYHGAHESLAQTVRQGHVGGVGEVALTDVGQHVHSAAGGLIGGQGAGVAGVEDGELGADGVALGAAPLEIACLLGDDAAVAALAAGGRDGQHRAHGEGGGDGSLAGEEVPEVPVVAHAHADGLGGIDDAAAAQGQQEVHALLAAKLDALIHLAAAGVGLDAGQLHIRQLCLGQGGGDGVIGAVFLHGAAAVDQQHLAAAEAAHQCAGVFLLPVAEGKEGGSIEGKVIHGCTSFPKMIAA